MQHIRLMEILKVSSAQTFFFPKSSLRDWPYIVMASFCASKRKTTALKIISSLLFLSIKLHSKNNIFDNSSALCLSEIFKFDFSAQKRPKDRHTIISYFVFWSARRFISSSSRLEDELYLNMLSRPKLRVPCTIWFVGLKRSTFGIGLQNDNPKTNIITNSSRLPWDSLYLE